MNYRKIVFIVSIAFLASCDSDSEKTIADRDFRKDMVDFVKEISTYAKASKNNFLIIPQNGLELLENGEGGVNADYLAAIDGVGREDLHYGYDADNQATPSGITAGWDNLLDIVLDAGKVAMVTDYCSTHEFMDDSYAKCSTKHYVSFAADHRELDNVPSYPAKIHDENDADVSSLSGVKNFLYLINPGAFETKAAYLNALKATNYDLLLIDLYFDGEALSSDDVASLKTKLNGGHRLVISYMSIGEAESYRPYWSSMPKSLVYHENPDWKGNYVVTYWEPEWKAIIYNGENSYTNKILTAGFDGVYLDIIEAYENFE